jgi:hypothetical protein
MSFIIIINVSFHSPVWQHLCDTCLVIPVTVHRYKRGNVRIAACYRNGISRLRNAKIKAQLQKSLSVVYCWHRKFLHDSSFSGTCGKVFRGNENMTASQLA